MQISRSLNFRTSPRKTVPEARTRVEEVARAVAGVRSTATNNEMTIDHETILPDVMTTTVKVVTATVIEGTTKAGAAGTDHVPRAMVATAETIDEEVRVPTGGVVRTVNLNFPDDTGQMFLTSRSFCSPTSIATSRHGLRVPSRPRGSEQKSCSYTHGYPRTKSSNGRLSKACMLS